MTGGILWSLQMECPIPPRLSPYADAVQRWLVDELLPDLDLPLDAAAHRRLAAAGVARYAGRLYPDATEADLRVLTALFTWFFLVDDACDGPGRLTPDQIRALRTGTVTVLHGGPRFRSPGLDGGLRRLLVRAWREPRRRMPARWRARVIDAVAHHLDGTWREAVGKAVGHRPGVAEYVELRRATSAAYLSFPLVEFVTGRLLAEPVYHHPSLRRVADTGNDLLSWFNDLASLEREQPTAVGHNLVLAIAGERQVPLADAAELVAKRWRKSMRRFVQLRAEVPSFGPALDVAVADHLDVIANAVRGTVDWTLESTRYAGKEGPLVNASGRAGVPS